MKAAVAIILGGLSLTQFALAEVKWSFRTYQDGIEIATAEGPNTKFQTNVAQRVESARLKKRVDVFTNWCGAAQTTTTSNPFKSVVGTWVVPSISLRSGQTNRNEPSIAQWVGIDGLSNGALIQGGTLTQVLTLLRIATVITC